MNTPNHTGRRLRKGFPTPTLTILLVVTAWGVSLAQFPDAPSATNPRPDTRDPGGVLEPPSLSSFEEEPRSLPKQEPVPVVGDAKPRVPSAELVIDPGAYRTEVEGLAFSPDGTLLAAAGGSEKVVRVWRVKDASVELLATTRGDYDRTTYGNTHCVAFSPDGKLLLVGVDDTAAHGNIRVYETDHLERQKELLGGHRSACRRLAFSRDGRYLASLDADGRILIWDWPKRKIQRRIEPHPEATTPIRNLLVFPTGRGELLELSAEGPRVYEARNAREIGPQRMSQMGAELRDWLVRLFEFRGGGEMASANVWDMRLDRGVWIAGGRPSGKSKGPWISAWTRPGSLDPTATYTGHRWRPRSAALRPDGRLAATADIFGDIHLWSTSSGKQQAIVKAPGKSVYEVAFDRPEPGRPINHLLFGDRIDRKNWARNRYGKASRAFLLDQHATSGVEALAAVDPLQEISEFNGATLRFRKDHSKDRFLLQKMRDGRVEQTYKLRHGANPTAYTFAGGPAAGVEEPVIFGDNEGMLALWDSQTDSIRRIFSGHAGMVTSLSVSPDRKLLISGSVDRTIRIWSLSDLPPVGEPDFDYIDSTVTELRSGSSSDRAGVRVGDQVISIAGFSLTQMTSGLLTGDFKHRPGETVKAVLSRAGRRYEYSMKLDQGWQAVDPLLNLYIGDDDSWVFWNPRGYYDASPGADRLVGWHVNQGPFKSAKYFGLHQFQEKLYRPDIIRKIVELGDVDEAVRAANAIRGRADQAPADFRDPDEIKRNAPPMVRLIGLDEGRTYDDPRVEIAATVSSTNGLPITKVCLQHNGANIKTLRPGPDERFDYRFDNQRIRLTPGRNTIEVLAFNDSAYSQANSGRRIVFIKANAVRRNAHVLAIGISQYQLNRTPLTALDFARIDAEAFAATIRSQAGGDLYKEVTVKLLTDAEATRVNIEDGLQWLVDRSTAAAQGDVVFLFLAGHGLLDAQGRFFLAGHDTDADRLRSTGVDWRDLERLLQEDIVKCHKVVMLDTCHAGAIEQAARSSLGDPMKRLDRPDTGAIYFSSCGIGQESLESRDWGHGAFTAAVLQSLADRQLDTTPADGLFNPDELADGIRKRVYTLTSGRQQPLTFAPADLRSLQVLQAADSAE